jgi:rod shape-determining protein MreD
VILFKAAGLLLGSALFQWWWNTHLSYWGAAPQFLLVLTVVIAARRGAVSAMLAGFFWGLFLDFGRAELFGASALTLTLCAYFVGFVRRQFDLRAAGPLAVLAAALTWGAFLLHGLLGLVFSRGFEWVGWTAALCVPPMNAIAALILATAWDLGDGGRRW